MAEVSADEPLAKSEYELKRYIKDFRSGKLKGEGLAKLVEDGKLNKGDRRKIQRASKRADVVDAKVAAKQAKKKTLGLSRQERQEKFGMTTFRAEAEERHISHTVCLGCRQKGHILAHCPAAQKDKICFNCGSKDHMLHECTKPRDPSAGLKWATCFICGERGHLSKDCGGNTNGMYPRGGCCHICQSKNHLVKDCPDKPLQNLDDKGKEEYHKQKQVKEDDVHSGPRLA